MSKYSLYIKPRPSAMKYVMGLIGVAMIIIGMHEVYRGEYLESVWPFLLGGYLLLELKIFNKYVFRLENPDVTLTGLYQIGDTKFIARSDSEADLFSELYKDSAPVTFIEYVRKF